MAAILKRETEQQEKDRQKVLREHQARAQAEQLRLQQQQAQQRQQQEAALRQQQEAAQRLQQQQEAAAQEALKRQQQQQAEQEAVATQQKLAAAAAAASQLQAQQQQAQQPTPPVDQSKMLQAAVQQPQAVAPRGLPSSSTSTLELLASGLGGLALSTSVGGTVLGSEAVGVTSAIPTSLGSAVAGSATVAGVSPTTAAELGTSSYLSALSDSLASVPHAVDQDRSRQYTPQNPYPTPATFPSTPSTIFSNPAIFEKLGTD